MKLGFVEKINTSRQEKIRHAVDSILKDETVTTELKRLYSISQKSIEELMIKYTNTQLSAEERREMAKRDREEAEMRINSLIKEKLDNNKVGVLMKESLKLDILKKIRELIKDEQQKIKKDEQSIKSL